MLTGDRSCATIPMPLDKAHVILTGK